MANSGEDSMLQRLAKRFVDAVVQDCPPEIAACEVCRRPPCADPAWVSCATRLAAARALRGDDREAAPQLQDDSRLGCACGASAGATGATGS